MSDKNELLSRVHFTPCFDFIMADKALKESTHRVTPAIVSLVLGRMWRYSKMSGRVSKTTILKIATQLGVSVKTVERSIKALEELRLVTDLDPNRRKSPHAYRVNEIAIMARHFQWVKSNSEEVVEVEDTPAEEVELELEQPVIVPAEKVGLVNVRKLRLELE
jgi:Fe2+ or Zn2+ uptake regulation protein